MLLLAVFLMLVQGAPDAAQTAAMPSQSEVNSVASNPPINVILIGWDGAQREHTYDLLDAERLPNLERLSKDGALVDINIYGKTDTKAGWAQILTGYDDGITGVYSNQKYQPIPKGYTIFERLEDRFGADNFATLAVIGKTDHVGADGPKLVPLSDLDKVKNKKRRKKLENKLKNEGKLIEKDGVKYYEIPGKPYYITKDSMDLFENGLHENDKVGTRALEVLDEYKTKPFFYFIHFADVDSNGHKFGENSAEYEAALESCDKWLGRIRYELKRLGLADKTLIYVTADHGFDEGQKSHKDAPYVFLATNDKFVTGSGTRADITPTILARYVFDFATITPPLSGRPLSK
jgi:hypothetical protein